MKRIRAAVTVLGAFALSGCLSTRMGQDIQCEGFDAYAKEMDVGAITRAIQTDPGLPGSFGPTSVEKADGPGLNTVKAIDDLFEPATKGNAGGLEAFAEEPRNILLLSGGGQWGAYGAGLFLGLACPTDLVTDRHNGALPCHDAAGNIDADALDFKNIDDMGIKTITGVSTGGLQASLLMIVFDRGRDRDIRAAALGQLVKSYLPARQGDLVNHTGFLLVPLTGSVAGTGPLRRHVAQVYQAERAVTDRRSFIAELFQKLDAPGVDALIGIVDGSDGTFKFVDINAMLRDIRSKNPSNPDLARGSRCMQAATLASSAMPVFHQQLRVVENADTDDRQKRQANTLFDGGVRRSVFVEYVGAKAAQKVNVTSTVQNWSIASAELFDRQTEARDKEAQLSQILGRRDAMSQRAGDGEKAALAEAIDKAAAANRTAQAALERARQKEQAARKDVAELDSRAAALPHIFVLRNGPTTREIKTEIDGIQGAEPQAMRAYDLLVNELEVGSIASLRLQNPLGVIKLSTAEGIATEKQTNYGAMCPKNKKKMFDPRFMRCLLLTGVQRAQVSGNPWWELPVSEAPKVPEARAGK